MTNSTIGVRLDEKTQNRLKSLGKSKERSPHYLMKKAIDLYLEVEEAKEEEVNPLKLS